MPLWLLWWNALQMVRPAFSQLRTFLWFATAVAGFTVRTDGADRAVGRDEHRAGAQVEAELL
jgi:hypothetical protein